MFLPRHPSKEVSSRQEGRRVCVVKQRWLHQLKAENGLDCAWGTRLWGEGSAWWALGEKDPSPPPPRLATEISPTNLRSPLFFLKPRDLLPHNVPFQRLGYIVFFLADPPSPLKPPERTAPKCHLRLIVRLKLLSSRRDNNPVFYCYPQFSKKESQIQCPQSLLSSWLTALVTPQKPKSSGKMTPLN